jgi:hypothetical protein
VNGWQTGGINIDTGAIQEFSFELAGVFAERTTGGPRASDQNLAALRAAPVSSRMCMPVFARSTM